MSQRNEDEHHKYHKHPIAPDSRHNSYGGINLVDILSGDGS